MTFHTDVDRALRAAGWRPGRQVPELVRKWREALEAGGRFILHPAAEVVLLEFGGLRIGGTGPGVETTPLDLNFDPTLAVGEEDRFLDYFAEMQGRSAFPLGDVAGGNAFLGVDIDGRTYMLMDDVYGSWPSFTTAVEGLLRGILAPHPTKPRGAV